MLLMLAFDVGVVFFGGICLCRFVEFAIVFLTCGQAWCTSVLSIFGGDSPLTICWKRLLCFEHAVRLGLHNWSFVWCRESLWVWVCDIGSSACQHEHWL